MAKLREIIANNPDVQWLSNGAECLHRGSDDLREIMEEDETEYLSDCTSDDRLLIKAVDEYGYMQTPAVYVECNRRHDNDGYHVDSDSDD